MRLMAVLAVDSLGQELVRVLRLTQRPPDAEDDRT
jgi:hypothetical protein